VRPGGRFRDRRKGCDLLGEVTFWPPSWKRRGKREINKDRRSGGGGVLLEKRKDASHKGNFEKERPGRVRGGGKWLCCYTP